MSLFLMHEHAHVNQRVVVYSRRTYMYIYIHMYMYIYIYIYTYLFTYGKTKGHIRVQYICTHSNFGLAMVLVATTFQGKQPSVFAGELASFRGPTQNQVNTWSLSIQQCKKSSPG